MISSQGSAKRGARLRSSALRGKLSVSVEDRDVHHTSLGSRIESIEKSLCAA